MNNVEMEEDSDSIVHLAIFCVFFTTSVIFRHLQYYKKDPDPIDFVNVGSASCQPRIRSLSLRIRSIFDWIRYTGLLPISYQPLASISAVYNPAAVFVNKPITRGYFPY